MADGKSFSGVSGIGGRAYLLGAPAPSAALSDDTDARNPSGFLRSADDGAAQRWATVVDSMRQRCGACCGAMAWSGRGREGPRGATTVCKQLRRLSWYIWRVVAVPSYRSEISQLVI